MSKLSTMKEIEINEALRLTPADLKRWEGKHFSNRLAENPPPIDPEKPKIIPAVPGFDVKCRR